MDHYHFYDFDEGLVTFVRGCSKVIHGNIQACATCLKHTHGFEVQSDMVKPTTPACRPLFLAPHTHTCACSWGFYALIQVKIAHRHKCMVALCACVSDIFFFTTTLSLHKTRGLSDDSPPCLVPCVFRQLHVLKPICGPCPRTAPCFETCLCYLSCISICVGCALKKQHQTALKAAFFEERRKQQHATGQ